MQDVLLYHTAVPILLGHPHIAGGIAAALYRRHGLSPHWMGRGHSLRLLVYAVRHPLALPLTPEHDRLWLRRLLDFAKENPKSGSILCLIPCCDESEAFLNRQREALEEHFTLLPRPRAGQDPLRPLVRAG